MHWTEHSIWWHVYPLGFAGAPIRPDAAHATGPDPSSSDPSRSDPSGSDPSRSDPSGPTPDGDAGPGKAPPPSTTGLARLASWADHAIELGANGLLLGPVFASQTHGYDTLDHRRIDPRLGTEEDFDKLVSTCRERGLRLVLDGVFNHVGAGHRWVRRALTQPDGDPEGDLVRIDRSDPGAPRPEVFEGHPGLVALNHAHPRAADEVAGIMTHWLDRGIDGWRLDAAYAVDPAFWARVLPRVRGRHPDAWFLGEVIHGDYPAIVEASGMDTVTQYELWKAIWSGLLDRNLFELDWALTRHNGFLDTFTPQTFVGNHDVTRIASRVGTDAAALALVLLMTVGGVPSIYAGDELGFTGVKEERLGGDDAIRPEFPATPSGFWSTVAADGSGALPHHVFRLHQDLIGLRRRHPWLATARTERLELSNTRYVYLARAAGGGASLVVELDLDGDRPTAVIRDRSGAELVRV